MVAVAAVREKICPACTVTSFPGATTEEWGEGGVRVVGMEWGWGWGRVIKVHHEAKRNTKRTAV